MCYDKREHKKDKINMKSPSKSTSGKRPKRSAAVARKAATHRQRPLHKRILLHPFSVMILLCAGVLVLGSTFQSSAASYDVTATVPAPIPTDAAVIQQPTAQQYFTTKPIEVSGTCTPQSYVKLYRNGNLSGIGTCNASLAFHIQTDLTGGANELNARIFNFTDQEGPASNPVMVYYGQPEPPVVAPQDLQISNVEDSNYQQGAVRQSSANPTISGLAPPFSDITVTFHSVVSTCKTQADGRGVWSCTLVSDLEAGVHRVDVTAVTPDGHTFTFPTFQIRVVAGLQTIKQEQPVLVLTSDYQYKVNKAGQLFHWAVGLNGGTPPYKVSVDWGDGLHNDLTHADQSVLTLSHAYDSPKDYAILVNITDAKGKTVSIQWVAVVKDSLAYAAFLSTHKGTMATILANVRQWLWIVWPVYIAVVLMVLSYWIGEQEGYRRLTLRRAAAAGKGGRR